MLFFHNATPYINHYIIKYDIIKIGDTMQSKRKRTNILVLSISFVIFFLALVVCQNNMGDQIWEYGFAHNILQGMMPYRDFNMVTLPFHSYLCAFFLKIIADRYIVYLFFHVLLVMGIAILIYRKTNKLYQYFLSCILLLIVTAATYNILLLFFFYLLLYLEEKKDKDVWIGVTLAFSILTKQSVGICLCLPILFLKDKKKVKKRMFPILFIIFSFVIFLISTNSFLSCLDYTFFGLFDFSNKNTNINIIFIIYVLYVYILIRKVLKTKQLKYIYYICFSTITIPLFDFPHFMLSILPFVIDFILKIKVQNKKLVTLLSVYCFLAALCALGLKGYSVYLDHYPLETDPNNLFYLTRTKSKEFDQASETIYNFCKKNQKTPIYIIGESSYLFSLDQKIPINKLSMILYGNNGYNGNGKLKKGIDHMPSNTLFILDNTKNSKQHNAEIHNYIMENSKKIRTLYGTVAVYQKK